MKKNATLKLVLASLFTAIGLLLPTVFHMFSLGGSIFLPMHIPVLLCGLICGWQYGLLVGFIVPLLSSAFTGMPPMFPVAIAMAAELAAYGAVTGLLSKKFNVFLSLIGAMLAGRAVSGIANAILLGAIGKPFMLSGFLSAAFVTALPGIIIQLVIIPMIMIALSKSKVLEMIH